MKLKTYDIDGTSYIKEEEFKSIMGNIIFIADSSGMNSELLIRVLKDLIRD